MPTDSGSFSCGGCRTYEVSLHQAPRVGFLNVVTIRKEVAEKVGIGFELPTQSCIVAPNAPKKATNLPRSAPRRGPAETESVPARPRRCGRGAHTIFAGHAARVLRFQPGPRTA